LSREILIKKVAEEIQRFEHPDNPNEENYTLIASLAPLSRKDLILRVREVLDPKRYSENNQEKSSRYLRDGTYSVPSGKGDLVTNAPRDNIRVDTADDARASQPLRDAGVDNVGVAVGSTHIKKFCTQCRAPVLPKDKYCGQCANEL
jgi:hypothetical protein